MKKFLLAATVASLGLMAAPAMAQTQPVAPHGTGDAPSNCTTSPCTDQDMNVTVTIQGNCQAIEVGDLDFGTHAMYTGTTPQNDDAQTTLDVLCNNGEAYTVELDYGIQPTGGNQRNVINDGSSTIAYNLYKDSARTQVWGTESVESGSSVAGTGSGQYDQRIVYGRLLQTNANLAGTYTDLVTASLTFN